MSSRRESKIRRNPRKRTDQGEGDPDPDQQRLETDLSSGAPPTPRGIADHPNRRYIVVNPGASYIPRPGPDRDHILRPRQVNTVLGAPADRVDEVIALVRDLKEPPSGGNSQAHLRQPASGIGHQRATGNRTTVSSGSRDKSDRAGSLGSHHGKSSSAGQGLFDRESGMSLDGFPSRSMEEGGVSGLGRRHSGDASGATTGAAAAPSSSSSGRASATSSALAADVTTFHTARAVTIRPARACYPHDEEAAVHRVPSLGALDRMDREIEEVERLWSDLSLDGATPAPLRAGNTGEDEMLTGDRGSIVTTSSRNSAAQGRGQPDRPSSRGQRYTHGRPPPPRGAHADRYATGAGQVQPRPASPTPSDSSIAETVLNVRRPTPPPPSPPHAQQSDVASLPSSRRLAVTAVGPPDGLRRGGTYSDPHFEQELEVPAVLIPGGPRGWLGLGGSRAPPQVSHRQERDGSDGELETQLRLRKARDE